jgi:hypothetical protein
MQKYLYTVTKAGNEPAPILVEQTKGRSKQEQAA